jgi:hypothetical protein
MNPQSQKIELVHNSDITRWVARSISNALCGGEFELGAARAGWKRKVVAANLVG